MPNTRILGEKSPVRFRGVHFTVHYRGKREARVCYLPSYKPTLYLNENVSISKVMGYTHVLKNRGCKLLWNGREQNYI